MLMIALARANRMNLEIGFEGNATRKREWRPPDVRLIKTGDASTKKWEAASSRRERDHFPFVI